MWWILRKLFPCAAFITVLACTASCSTPKALPPPSTLIVSPPGPIPTTEGVACSNGMAPTCTSNAAGTGGGTGSHTVVSDTTSPCVSTTIPPSLQSIDTQYGALITQDIAGTGLPKLYIEAEIMQESSGDTMATGDGDSSRGLLQLNVNNGGFTQAYPNFVQPAVGDLSDPRYNPTINLKIAIGEFAQWFQQDNGDLQATSLDYETGGARQNTVPGYDTSVQNICAGNTPN